MVGSNIQQKLNTLPLMEAFYTIQGEGSYTGTPAYFIRLGGCDVGCHWCDVKESWDANKFEGVKIDDIVQGALQYSPPIAVVTGGEPLMHSLDGLCNTLRLHGIRRHLETSGAHPMSGEWDWICFSPKKFKSPLQKIYTQAHELKVIVYNRSDFSWAESFAGKVEPDCKLYLQPEWDRSPKVMPWIVDYVKEHPHWKISLQVHKYLNIP